MLTVSHPCTDLNTKAGLKISATRNNNATRNNDTATNENNDTTS